MREPKVERVGEWMGTTPALGWQFTCCGVARKHRGAEEVAHACGDCGAVWRRPSP